MSYALTPPPVCSGCIRGNLEFQERSGPPSCPSCRQPCDTRDLLPNHALGAVAEDYVRARAEILAFARAGVAKEADGGRSKRALGGAGFGVLGAPDKKPRRPDPGRDDKAGAPSSAGVLAWGRIRTRAAASARSSEGVEVVSVLSDSSGSEQENDEGIDSPCSSGEEYVGEPPPRRSRTPSESSEAPSKARQATASLQVGFVCCPICSRRVPEFYINSHMDACLTGGDAQAQDEAVRERGAPSASAKSSAKGIPSAVDGASSVSSKPLAVPPKLVPSLSSERALRSLLRRYHLPTEGRKGELAERYSRLRLEAQTANDRGEHATLAVLAQRVVAQERKRAASRDGGGAIESLVRANEGSADKEGLAEIARSRTEGWTFAELVQITRERDAARKARREAERAAQGAEGAGREGQQPAGCADAFAEAAVPDVARGCPQSEDAATRECESGEEEAHVDVPRTQPCA